MNNAESPSSYWPQVNDFAKRFNVVGDDDDAAPTTDAAPEAGLDRTGGLGYHEFSFKEDDLTVPRTYDRGHLIQFGIAGINDALLEPGRFLRLAIKQMRYLGSGNKRFPEAWLDDKPRIGRYVHPQVLKERLPVSGGLDHTPPMAAAPCPWSELARARLLTLHKQETGDNIDTFLEMGFSEDAVSCASSHREQHIAECGTAGTIRNETVTFVQNVSVSLRKSSSVSVSLRLRTRTIPRITNSLRVTYLT